MSAATKPEQPWYFGSGKDGFRGNHQTLADLELDPLTEAKILEWLAFKIWVSGNEGVPDGDYHSKSYDPLTIELGSRGGGTAHSYVFNLGDGGRHHDFSSLADLERMLFEEAIGTVSWAYKRGTEDALEGLARHFYLEANPGQGKAWDSWSDDRIEWEDRHPYYERAREIVRSGREH